MRRRAVLLLTVMTATLVVVASPAWATTFTVNSIQDTGDTTPDGTCDTCTLREAIQEANANNNDPTVDVINFDIPGVGLHTITPGLLLPDITERVTINGYSQPGATANTLKVGNDAALKIELDGASIPAGGGPLDSGLKIKAANSTVKGLVISNWENCVFLDTGTTGNQVIGNFIGTDVSGTHPGNTGVTIQAGADDNIIGGTTAATRNIISGNNGHGVSISGARNKVQGNYIGTSATGDTTLGNNNGVVIQGAANNIIGGTTAVARNVISGNSTFGINIFDPGATGNKVQGNYIGTSVAGDTRLANGNAGVRVSDASNNTIGGTTAGAGNIISGNGSDGVEILGSSSGTTGNRILSNSIYENDALGIDLVHFNDFPGGVTCNDSGDGDVGPNNTQNFPVINSAKLTTKRIGGHRRKVILIKGTLNSEADKTYNVQFFGSPEANPISAFPSVCETSGFGEGKRFLGQKSVTTNDSGNASFTFQSRKKVPNGQVVTATATNKSTGDTSEFSKACTVPGVPCP